MPEHSFFHSKNVMSSSSTLPRLLPLLGRRALHPPPPPILFAPFPVSFRPSAASASFPRSSFQNMSFWTCSSCTFVNTGTSSKCEVCEEVRRIHASSSSSSFPPASLVSSSHVASKWGCRACTFLNKESDKVCDICGTPKSSVSLDKFAEFDSDLDDEDGHKADSKGVKFWPLRSCSFTSHDSMKINKEPQKSKESPSNKPNASLYPHQSVMPDVSKKRKSSEESPSKASDGGTSTSAFNNMLGQLHLEKIYRRGQQAQDVSSWSRTSTSDCSESQYGSLGNKHQCIVVLTYNVWFREDLELTARMNAIGAIICEHNPHFICLQEVTPTIYSLFQNSSWWRDYRCSVTPELASKRAYYCVLLSRVANTSFSRNPYANTVMGRELSVCKVEFMGGMKFVIATTHLESPCPAPPTWNQMFSPERVAQAKEAFSTLEGHANVVFGGDMNWDDKLDGDPPLPGGWSDAWLTLRPQEEGLTYDSKENPMLSGSRLRKRLDRLFYHLEDFKLESIERVGTKPIPGVTFEKEIKVKKQTKTAKLPVLPSDHFGLLLKISPR